ncbi:MAG: methylated-DNA--[protein]-cysteine S-methyltransferase [Candidatus Woesearchaeota archaeon]|nr:methylated-DNA--[protein]-cysteine S-methyltransferase [Candidatus Woesearchaeota archaeon]
MALTNKTYYAKGKRGIVYTADYNGKNVIVKEPNPNADVNTIEHEATILQLVNTQNIGPTYIGMENGALIAAFIDGMYIKEWIAHAPPKEIVVLLKKILAQCRVLDELGISKLEMTRPHKHIIVRANEPIQIDFDRATKTTKPKNVTQLCQWLTGSTMRPVLEAKGIFLPRQQLLDHAKTYKDTYTQEAYMQLAQLIEKKELSSFRKKVYDKLIQVPKGKVTTYKALAAACKIQSSQAIGQALKHNPCAPRVPCHRVVKTDGSIGGFNGHTTGKDIQRKIQLLHKEGVNITDGKVVDFAQKQHTF